MMIYGNPSFEHIERMQQSTILTTWEAAGYLDRLKQYPYPNETLTKLEVLYLIELTNTTDAEQQEYNNLIDTNLFDVWSSYIETLGIKISGDELHHVVSIYDPIIDYLKLLYNRPRPFQFAGVHGLPLYPRVKCGSTDASYPSGHTLFSCWTAHYLTDRYPQHKSHFWRMVMDVKRSREELGVHYLSDGLFSLRIYKELKPLWFT